MCIFVNVASRSRPSSSSKLMSTTRSSYNLYLQPGAGANRRIKNPIFKITININCNKQKYAQKSTFSLHMLNKFSVI